MKSSLEIALERAKSLTITSNKEEQWIKEGQLLAGTLFKNGLSTFHQKWQEISPHDQKIYLKGFMRSALRNFVLTTQDDQLQRTALTLEALRIINPEVATLSPVIEQLLQSYSNQYTTFTQNLMEQLEAHLAQKSQNHLARTGQTRHFTIQNDPESATIYTDEIKKFQLHFQEHLKQHKWRLIQLFELNPEEFDL